jgi:hypothetical protein
MGENDGWAGLRYIGEAIVYMAKRQDGNITDALFKIADAISYVGRIFDIEFENRRHDKEHKLESSK